MMYDSVIVGAGIAGISAAKFASKNGLKVALIEKENIGGLDSTGGGMFIKYIFASLRELIRIKNSEELSINVDKTNLKLNYSILIKKYHESIHKVILENQKRLDQQHIDIYIGAGVVKNSNLVLVNNVSLKTKNIILAMGFKPDVPNIKGIKEALKNKFAVPIVKLYKETTTYDSIAVIGGATNAVEVATFFSNIGSKVYLIVKDEDILNNIDLEMKEELKKDILNKNVQLFTHTNVIEFKEKSICVQKENLIQEVFVDKVYLADEYKHNNRLYANQNIKFEESGIITNNNCETNIKGIYAIGDINHKPKQSNLAVSEGIVAVKHILGIPHEFAYVFYVSEIIGLRNYVYYGYTEEQVKKLDIPYDVRYIDMSILKVVTNIKDRQIGKMIFNSVTGELLAVHMIGEDSCDYITDLIKNIKDFDGVEEKSRLNAAHFSMTTSLIELIQNYRTEYVEEGIKKNLVAYFQPKYDLIKNRIIGCEALMRVVQEDIMYPPQKMIELYEKNQMIKFVDMKILDDACKLINELQRKKIIDDEFKVAINFSIYTLLDISVEKILSILENNNVKPSRIIIEITERVMKFAESIKITLIKLKSKGFTISIDDYSTGHSSLSNISKFPIDEIKFDMSLLPSVKSDNIDKKIYIDLYNMFASFGYTIISEGVNTKFQLQFLKENNMRYIQGYIFSNAVSATQLIKLLEINKESEFSL